MALFKKKDPVESLEGMPPAMNQPQDQYYQEPAAQQPYVQEPAPAISPEDTSGRIEEVAEAIIDEKWNELVKDINKVIEWKERTDGELKRIQQEITGLKERFETLHRGVLGKISEYDQNLHAVGSEIKAMEMAFKNVLPTFTENVNKLERLTKGINPK